MPEIQRKILESFKKKEATVAVLGLGYVGLPLALELAEAGFKVFGIDIDLRKIESLLKGESYIEDVPHDRLLSSLKSGRLIPSSDFQVLSSVSAISICVPTPLRKTKDPDLSFIIASLDAIESYLHSGMLVVLESTTYPGTTREMFSPRLLAKNLQVGKDIFIAFSPERVDPGNKIYNTRNTPKVVGGMTPRCTEVAQALYQYAVDKVIPAASSEEAEMVKLLENTFRAVNIGLVNELLLMCDRMGINIWNVINAASTKPFGFMPFYPGPGIGGHCIPLDPAYLSWKAKTYDFYNRFIELASDVNGNMPRFVVQKASTVLNELSKSLKGSKVLLLGVSYKANVSDTRESPALEVYRLAREMHADLFYHDPHVPSLKQEGFPLESLNLEKQADNAFDLGILLTHHSEISKTESLRVCRKILDCRNFFKGDNFEKHAKVELL